MAKKEPKGHEDEEPPVEEQSSSAPPPPPPPPPPRLSVAQLAAALGLPEEQVAKAFAELKANPAEVLAALLEGRAGDRLEALAKALRVGKARLAAAMVEAGASPSVGEFAGGVAALAGREALSRARDYAGSAFEVLLDILADSVPRFLNRLLAVFLLGGIAFLALGLLAFIDDALFRLALTYIAGAALLGLGAGMVYTAWKLHEATAVLRTLARLARKFRAR